MSKSEPKKVPFLGTNPGFYKRAGIILVNITETDQQSKLENILDDFM